MVVKIGLNGFGRIGRLLVRISIDESCKCGDEIPIVSIVNDPTVNPQSVGYLIKKDGQYGTYDKEVIDMDNCVMIAGHRLEIIQETNVSKIPWHKSCPIQYIIDTTGQSTSCKEASKLLQENIKGAVTIGTGDVPIFIMGVNHTCYKPNMKSVSAGSPTLNCLTAMLRVLHENFKVKSAIATAIHPYGNCCNIMDGSSAKGRKDGRSAILNIIPIQTEAGGRFVTRIMPELEDRVKATAFRVPAACVGAVDLTVLLYQEASIERVNAKFREAADTYMKGIIRYTNEDTVSSDIVGDPHSCVIDGNAGAALPSKCLVKCFAWYDAEYAFAHRLYDLLKYVISRYPKTK